MNFKSSIHWESDRLPYLIDLFTELLNAGDASGRIVVNDEGKIYVMGENAVDIERRIKSQLELLEKSHC